MKSRFAIVFAPLAAMLAAGCAQNGSLTTGSIDPSAVNEQQAKELAANKAVCATLAAQIEELNKGGIADKVTKAAAKKYKMKTADLAKASELNKANAEFQEKCSNYPMATVASLPKAEEEAKKDDAKAAAAKPPVPPRKSAAQAAAPKPQAAQTQATAPAAKTAAAPQAQKAKTETVAVAEPETKQASAEMTSSPTVQSGPFASPRLSVAPPTVTTTTGTP